ncbi:hypothetical protein GCM10018952_51730 [Streptosporangium vulgare]
MSRTLPLPRRHDPNDRHLGNGHRPVGGVHHGPLTPPRQRPPSALVPDDQTGRSDLAAIEDHDDKMVMKVSGAFIGDILRRHTIGRVLPRVGHRKFYTDLDTFQRCFHTKFPERFPLPAGDAGVADHGASRCAFRCRDEGATGAVRSRRTEDHSAMAVTC